MISKTKKRLRQFLAPLTKVMKRTTMQAHSSQETHAFYFSLYAPSTASSPIPPHMMSSVVSSVTWKEAEQKRYYGMYQTMFLKKHLLQLPVRYRRIILLY